jgi:hypothetical protein
MPSMCAQCPVWSPSMTRLDDATDSLYEKVCDLCHVPRSSTMDLITSVSGLSELKQLFEAFIAMEVGD